MQMLSLEKAANQLTHSQWVAMMWIPGQLL